MRFTDFEVNAHKEATHRGSGGCGEPANYYKSFGTQHGTMCVFQPLVLHNKFPRTMIIGISLCGSGIQIGYNGIGFSLLHSVCGWMTESSEGCSLLRSVVDSGY